MKTNIIRSAKIIGSCTGISRVLGFVRMILMARLFGTSLFASAFFLAFMIPNMFRRLFGEGALSAAFVPVYTESMEKEGLDKANELAGKVATMLSVALAIIVTGGVLLSVLWLNLLPIGEKAAAVLPLLSIMLPYAFFICMVALFMAMINSHHHFFVPAVTPVLLNVVWILILLFVCPAFVSDVKEQVTILAYGILAAGVLQLLVQIPVLMKLGIKLRVSVSWSDARVHKVLLLMGPGVIGMGLFQINTLIGKGLAYFVDGQATAALTYAELIVYLPLGIFGTALGTVLLPTFSQQVARGENKEMLSTMSSSIKSLMFIMIPAAVGLTVLAYPVIEAFFERGKFNVESTLYTSRALFAFAPGLVVFGLYKVFVPAFYAHKDTKTPVYVSLVAILFNLALMILSIIYMPVGYKHAGIAFASVLSSTLNCIILGILINRRIGNPGWSKIGGSFLRSLIAAIVMGISVYYLYSYLSGILGGKDISIFFASISSLVITIVAGVSVYFLMGSFLCREELKSLKH